MQRGDRFYHCCLHDAQTRPSNLESYFEHLLLSMAPDLPKPKREFRFHPTRRWRFDFAFPSSKLAIECDGGQWRKFGGRHARDSDREKLNEAAVLGWRVLRKLCNVT